MTEILSERVDSKIPEALAVLDEIADCAYIPVSDARLSKARAAFAGLIKAANNILDNVDNGGCCSNVVSEKAQDILYKALAAVEKLP